MPELPPDDPVTTRPMAGLVLISVFLLMLTVSWSLYDEFYGLRPWRSYQAEFSKVYSSYLEKQYQKRKADEQKFYATPEYQKLFADVKAAHDAAADVYDRVVCCADAELADQDPAAARVSRQVRLGDALVQYLDGAGQMTSQNQNAKEALGA